MSKPSFHVKALSKQSRSGFCSENAELDRYFETQASQDIRRRVAACYIAIETATDIIAGYYTLSAADIPLTELPDDLKKRLPRYPTIPAVRLGRLAIDRRFQGMGLGGALLFDAVHRSASADIAVYAVIVEAKDASAIAFYRHHGFTSYGSAHNSLIAPLHQLIKA